jgi:hypothetical protein
MVAVLLTIISVCFGVAGAQSVTPTIFNRAPFSDVMSYWTPETMAAAVPKDMGLLGAPMLPAMAPLPSGLPGGAGGSRPEQAANPGPGLLSISAAPVPADGAYPGPHDTFAYGPKYRKYPVSTIGKLFFTEPGVGNFVCSAAVTTGGAPQNIIWTAGHCVASQGGSSFFTNWLFCPSYDSSQGGPNPALGCWSWSFAATSSEWFNNGAFTRDYAIIGLAPTGTVISANVATVTGGLGFAWNWARDQHWVHLGYPAAAPFSGGLIIETATEHRFDDTPDLLGPATNSWGTSQTGGSSGSAVIKGFYYGLGPGNPNGTNWINSNVSYGYVGQPGELYGPYFDTQVCNFWKSNTAWPGTC